MTQVPSNTNNFLARGAHSALVTVKIGPRGNPDSVSYWEQEKGERVKHSEVVYKNGVLLDVRV